MTKRNTIIVIEIAIICILFSLYFVLHKTDTTSGIQKDESVQEKVLMDSELKEEVSIDTGNENNPSRDYISAIMLLNDKQYEEAITVFTALGDYQESVKLRKQAERQLQLLNEKDALCDAEVGDLVSFGAYEQDNNIGNGPEPIEWIVLDKYDNGLLLISKYALDCKRFSEDYAGITWQKSGLREWMNSSLLNAAFDDAEKSLIATTTVTADSNPEYESKQGKDTEDKLFLLSIAEVEKYFPNEFVRQCEPTAYAVEKGAYLCMDGNCWWWLRTIGRRTNHAAFVFNYGVVDYVGNGVSRGGHCVRPALWICTDELK